MSMQRLRAGSLLQMDKQTCRRQRAKSKRLKSVEPFLEQSVSSLRRGHANSVLADAAVSLLIFIELMSTWLRGRWA
jgi:hypothetical protein